MTFGASAAVGPRRVWVDLANSPQVLFFHRLILRWRSEGVEVLVTSRPHAQTGALADQYGIVHDPIGTHGGSSWLGLGMGLGGRALALSKWMHGRSISLAISHNSYAQILAARLRGVPAVTAMDFEHHWANHLAFRLAWRVVVPAPFPAADLLRFGALSKAVRYPGIKEQLYLDEAPLDPSFRRRHGIRDDSVLVVVRPAAVGAAYHRNENPLIDVLLNHLATFPGVDLVFLPRFPEQQHMLSPIWKQRALVPQGAWDGPSLLRAADLVFSGGGTMVREAAVLGTPAYSLFHGRPLAVDEYLVRLGRLTCLRTAAEVRAVVPRSKGLGTRALIAGEQLLNCVSSALLGHPSPPCDVATAPTSA